MNDPGLSSDLAVIAGEVLARSAMGSTGLYLFDEDRAFAGGVIVGMPPEFTLEYERRGVPIDPVLAEMRDSGRPVSTRTVLGSGWERCQLYRRVSGRFGLTGFAALPLYRGARISGVLYLGATDREQAARLEEGGLCDMTVYATQAATELLAVPRRRHALTPRQDAVARLVAEGLTNRQVAEELSTGEAAVRKHMKALHAIFGVRTRTALARRYLSGDP